MCNVFIIQTTVVSVKRYGDLNPAVQRQAIVMAIKANININTAPTIGSTMCMCLTTDSTGSCLSMVYNLRTSLETRQ